MFKYDPENDPDPAEWLVLDESIRIEVARRYHRRMGAELPNIHAHAVVHCIAENQLAEGLPQATRALERLRGEGLARHDALHALAAVLMEHLWNLSNRPLPAGDPHAPYLMALDKLTAEAWRHRYD